MPKIKPKLIQNVLEVRYKQGYRYLDRCGDAMIILEEALPTISDNKIWMPEKIAPTGARMKCPDLDLTLVFDASRLCLDQNPANILCPFKEIAQYVFNTITAKFGIQTLTRFGNRQKLILAADSVEDAASLSIKLTPLNDWPISELEDMSHKSYDATCVLENEDSSKGVRFSTGSVYKINAPQIIDERLKKPPRSLDKGQREALLDQLRRAKQRQEDPAAGLEVDIDYWWMKPEASIETFYEKSGEAISELIKNFCGG